MRRTIGIVAAVLLGVSSQATAQVKFANQGISANQIAVGAHVDLSGPGKGYGVPFANGMKMAVEEINAAGGINSRQIKLTIEDTGYDTKRAVLATQKLIERDQVFALVGPMGSAAVYAAQDSVLQAGVFQLFPLSAADSTFKMDSSKPQDRLKFSMLLPYAESTRVAVKYMIESKGSKKPCIFYQDDEYGESVLDGFKQQLAEMKIEPASITSFKRGATDFSSQAARLKADGCDLVLMGTIIRETIGIMLEAKKINFETVWLGAWPANVPEVTALGKDVVEGLYAAGAYVVPSEDTAPQPVKDWIAKYKTIYKASPNAAAIFGYNAFMAFAHYANLAGKDLSGEKLLAALESGSTYKDIFGSAPVQFSPKNHLASHVANIQQVKDGRWVLIKDGLSF